MHSFILILHSLNRFILLVLLLFVLYRTLTGWLNKSEFSKTDDKLSLFLFISTHTQLLLGLILYFVSPLVVFSGASMKDAVARYWLVEHFTGMLVAIVLITIARISMKKLSSGQAKHKRMFVLNAIALVFIIALIATSHRGFFTVAGN
ncbi:MAG: cytochrome B [Bacteroidetes bacterium]|nr:cytochrome B [Bacteroidota bacterium]MBS1539422.1 cytochrome B [Bacteroidota bacterium]